MIGCVEATVGDGDDEPPGGDPPAPIEDRDGDGLDDPTELMWANQYRGFLSADPADGCPMSGIVARVRPHPMDSTLVSIVYVHLYEHDCSQASRVGDDAVLAVTIDPQQPFPGGLVATRARSPAGTACPRDSACGRCPGLPPCETAAGGRSVVYLSKDKHTTYVQLSACVPVLTCGDSCALATASIDPPLVNVGEPLAPLVRDLTQDGFITQANGWREPRLFGFDPWDPTSFGDGGTVAHDLDDTGFLATACR